MTTAAINVSAIKAFSDNYIWAIRTNQNNKLALVDPGDAQACINYIEQHHCILSSILITHHHADHVGGISELLEYCQKNAWPLTVYGPVKENIPHCDVPLDESKTVELTDLGIQFDVIDLPGHTLGHIAYHSEELLFCGDTLFSGGCGRLFEGTPNQMYHSLNKLAALKASTKVYCAHEYTEANLSFALTVDPENFDLIDYFNQVRHLRENNQSTIPSSIGLEKSINPFLRCNVTALQQSAEVYADKALSKGEETFAVIREWKNNF